MLYLDFIPFHVFESSYIVNINDDDDDYKQKIHKMHEKCIFYKFSVFFKFQFFNSVILKNTEKKKFFFLNKYISVF